MTQLSRADAARFLTGKGLQIAATTLAKKAVQGSGPPYQVWNGRATYCIDDLEKWAEAQLGPKLTSTAQRNCGAMTKLGRTLEPRAHQPSRNGLEDGVRHSTSERG
jgi:hypothetical protein